MTSESNDTEERAKSVIILDRNPSAEKEERALESDPDSHRKHLSNQQFAQDIRERRKYAIYAYKITKNWACALVFVIVAQMFLSVFGVGLEKEEFITVVTTTTASMFGFWWLVGKYLFSKPE